MPHTHPRPKAHPVPSRPHPPGWRLSKPATASPMGRRPKSPNQWRGHGVESLGGRRPQQAGTPIRPRRAVSPSDPRDVVPRDEGTRVSGERSTTPAQPEAPPLRRCPTLTPGRRLIQFRLAPTPPAGGYLSRRQPRPWAGGRKVRTSGAGMVSNPSAAGGPSRPAHPSGPAGRSAHPTLETWCPATKEQGFAGSEAPRPTCRRPTYALHPARLQ